MTASTDELFEFMEKTLEIEITEWQKQTILHYIRNKDAEQPSYPSHILSVPKQSGLGSRIAHAYFDEIS